MATTFVIGGEKTHSEGGVRERVGEAEWKARIDLAAAYRLMAHFQLTDTIYTHISLRVPGEEEHFLLNAFGTLFEEVTASTLVKVDVNGEVIDDPTGLGVNRAGFVIHGAIHAARHDVACVLHTHSIAGIGVSAQEHGLLPISQHASAFIDRIGYHEFEGVALDLDEQKRLVADLGPHRAMILSNHGLLTAGRTVAESFQLMLMLERACQAQIAAMSGGTRLRTISAEVLEASGQLAAGATFARDWAALLRLAERLDPAFRD